MFNYSLKDFFGCIAIIFYLFASILSIPSFLLAGIAQGFQSFADTLLPTEDNNNEEDYEE